MKHLLIALFLAGSLFAFGQSTPVKESIKVELGKAEKLKWSVTSSGIIMENETNFYVLDTKHRFLAKPKYFISIFDRAKMSKTKQVELVLPKRTASKSNKKVAVKFEGVQVIGKHMVLISSFYDRHAKETAVYLQGIDDAGKLDTKIVEIEVVPGLANRKLWGYGQGFEVISSDDKSKFVVVRRDRGYERLADSKVHLKVFDKDINPVWSGDLKIPVVNMVYNVYNYQLDNDGNVYLLIRKWKVDTKVSEKTGKVKLKLTLKSVFNPTFLYTIYHYDHKKEQFKGYDIDLGTRRITDIVFKANPNNNDIVCAGFYTNKGNAYGWIRRGTDLYYGTRDAIGGTFYARIDKSTAKVVASEAKDFDQNFTKLFAKKTSGGKTGSELLDFDLKSFAILEDGSAAIVAEKTFVNHYYFEDNMFTGLYIEWYAYHYEDLLVVKFKGDGKVDWSLRIPKKQVTMDDGGYASSYIFNVSNNKMHFIFLDAKSTNAKLEKQTVAKQKLKPSTMFFPELSVANLVTVEMDGTMKRTHLFTSKATNMVIIPKASRLDDSKLKNQNALYTYGINYDMVHWFFPFLPLKYKYSKVTFEQQ
jgi:hypothetical protein